MMSEIHLWKDMTDDLENLYLQMNLIDDTEKYIGDSERKENTHGTNYKKYGYKTPGRSA